MKKKVSFLVALTLMISLSFVLALPAGPSTPTAYYGEVSYNGNLIPNGYKIVLKLDNITIKECPVIDGKYGYNSSACIISPDAEGKLDFYILELKAGTLDFKIPDNPKTKKLDFTLSYLPKLPIPVTPPTKPSTGSGGGGGSSGGGSANTGTSNQNTTNSTTNSTNVIVISNSSNTNNPNGSSLNINTQETQTNSEKKSFWITGKTIDGFADFTKSGLGIVLIILITLLFLLVLIYFYKKEQMKRRRKRINRQLKNVKKVRIVKKK